eukprot:CAMPEP_0198665606 /NCGR_PEP_ID=MMETSP1467-20131203/61167_1 /TAXON_ID=1462469 /ORGANISM="unid. sp., Strain CCMP2135" /LENGTH=58 /DNA_ID=CAMNT_0044402207 /DNA_START=96 /DNA_END=269 /DNA_ORIENTATION=+
MNEPSSATSSASIDVDDEEIESWVDSASRAAISLGSPCTWTRTNSVKVSMDRNRQRIV